jgi:hypothetical protein
MYDLLFQPYGGCGNTDIEDQGGPIASAVPVHLIFWGAAWPYIADPAIPGRLLSDTLVTQVQALFRGPWSAGLRQYRVKPPTFHGFTVYQGTEPKHEPDAYQMGDVTGLIGSLIGDGTLPNPGAGGIVHMVMMPPNTKPKDSHGKSVGGQHSWFLYEPNPVACGFIRYGSVDSMTQIFCHELAETCTDTLLSAWRVDGASGDCGEIGDLCDAAASVDGVSVSAYWSKVDGLCLIPRVWSVRRALKYRNIVLNGSGLRTLQKPSLEDFVRNS